MAALLPSTVTAASASFLLPLFSLAQRRKAEAAPVWGE
jgi:hypothetical protein